MRPITKLQFRVLYREFLFRVVDLELLAPQGDMSKLLGQLAALLLLVSLWLTPLVLAMGSSRSRPGLGLLAAWTAEHFVISTTMLTVGLFAVLSWDSVFPDRRDVLVLAPLPVRARTLFAAKVAAVATALSLTVVLLNFFTGLAAPLAFAGGGVLQVMRSFAAYWITMLAGGAFIFCSLLSLQGLAQLLPRQRFLRVSSILQIATFVLLLTVYFVQPGFSSLPELLANLRVIPWLPSYWFFALFQELNGPIPAPLAPLVHRAWMGLAAALAGAAASYLICYFRTLRKIAEAPDILPRPRRVNWLPRFGGPVATAIVRFSLRTLVRSRQHRVIFSFYWGNALALVLFIAKVPLRQRQLAAHDPWHQVNAPFLAASVLLMCSAVLGIRVVFSMPLERRANWIFRLAPVRGGRETVAAVRRSIFVLAVAPVWSISAAVLLWLWPWRQAAGHLAVLALLGIVLAELCLLGFQKIPFTCSYLPGKSYANMAVLGYLGLLFLITVGADFERGALVENPARFMAILSVFGIAAACARWWTAALADSPDDAALQFEEAPAPAIFALKVHPDGAAPLR